MQRNHKGRPWKMPIAGKPAMLGLRVSPRIKKALMKSARHNGRSLSHEAEIRLEKSFRR
jgi:hypothetical protein